MSEEHNLSLVFLKKNEQECLTFVLSPLLQEDKIYVQHRVKEQAKLLWDLIANKNAFFYIAG